MFVITAAIMARVVGREAATSTKSSVSRESAVAKDMVKFNLIVLQIFKRSSEGPLADAVKRMPVSLIVSSKELECNCPKIKVNK